MVENTIEPTPTPYYLRLGVTDACGFRCPYCQPGGPQAVTRNVDLLSVAEISRVARILADLGVARVRLTGGEPLLRSDVAEIIATLAATPGIREVSLTTNGERLARMADDLAQAGLHRINIHLDTLRDERFKALTGRNGLEDVLLGIKRCQELDLSPVKLNVVLMRGHNDDELADFAEFALRTGVTVRFIELMNTGPASPFVLRHFLSAKEAQQTLSHHFDLLPRFEDRGAAPAREFGIRRPTDKNSSFGDATVGFIASESDPFCDSCNRLRLNAAGRFFGCLYEPSGVDIRSTLREKNDTQLRQLLTRLITRKRSHHPDIHAQSEVPFAMAAIGG